MTKILIDKETVELAREIIQDYIDDYGPHEKDSGSAYTLMKLDQALEQSTDKELVMSERESVAVWLEKDCDEQYLADRVRVGDHAKEMATKGRESQCGQDRKLLLGHLSPSLVGVGEIDSTTQKQEPVAWMWDVNSGAGYSSRGIDFQKTDIPFAKQTPLYTSPPQETIYLERLCRIMETFDLASGHAETMDDALNSLETELRDVLGHYRQAFKNINTQCPNCASLEAQNSELDAKLAELERKEFAVHAVDIARRAVAEEREACAKACEELTFSKAGPSREALRQRLLCAEAIRARGKT